MHFIKVPHTYAELVKKILLSHGAIDHTHAVEKDETHVYFPLATPKDAQDLQYPTIQREGRPLTPQTDLKGALAKKLTAQELELVKTAYDLVGDIAIIEIEKELQSKAKIIGETLLGLFPNINVVLQRGKHEGTFRTQNLLHLAGENRKETLHKENGVLIKLNVEEVYFSARLSTERKRIAGLVEPGEHILVCFSGCAPYPCVLAKHTRAETILGIEINPTGHAYGLENIKLNALKNVTLLNGDIRDLLPTMEESYDRVLMPLPKDAEQFLDVTLPHVLQNGTLHIYQFWQEKDIDQNTQALIAHINTLGYTAELLQTTLCGQHAPGTYRICLDLRIT
ncbi:MAG: class I SAM-dependent methyltransferase family protein [Nitrosarchaeum sp.]|nr:class I SAM-dependent methyltransferase family protein [Nitrosarchaeum sp.]